MYDTQIGLPDTDLITNHAATIVLWEFGIREKTYPPGGHEARLISAIMAADPTNQYLHSLGFPAVVAAVQLGQRSATGLDTLKHIAGAA